MRNLLKRIVPFFALALLALGTTNSAQAAGTVAGTQVDNQAKMDFNVAGVGQASVYSDGNGAVGLGGKKITSFLVDRKINLTVAKTDGSIVEVAPGQLKTVLTFTVQNTGNASQDFALSSIAQSGSTESGFGLLTDNFDAAIVGIYLESEIAPNGYTDGVDTLVTSISNLAPTDPPKTVYLVVNIPSAQIDKDIAIYSLVATAKELGGAAVTETAGADTILTMDTVFADAAGSDDGARDAAFSARNAFKVKAPVLTMAKTSAVISDPVNGTTNPKAIPGAIVEYTVTITNNAAATGNATNVSISDSLAAMVGAGYISYNAGSLNITTPGLYSGVTTTLTDAISADEGQVVANVVTVGTTGTVITLAPGQSAVIKYRVTITAA